MGRTLKLGLGLIAILSFVALTAIGQITTTTQDPQKEKTPETITINGKVTAIDAASVTVVDDQKASHTIAIDAKTKISKAGKDAKITDVKADDAVVVEARKGEGETLTAITIKVS